MRVYGLLLMMLGFVLVLVAVLLVRTSVEVEGYGELANTIIGEETITDKVANLSGMHLQSLLLNSGLASFLSGILLFGFGAVVDALNSRSEWSTLPTQQEKDELMFPGTRASEFSQSESHNLEDQLAEFKITRVGDLYEYAGFQYERPEDAIAYARLQQKRSA